ncbi:hypothetical protein Zmor_002624 [Zophobas morio]|uniref:Uncharacterized protein n=1 Tax=Zophobas morio TaxID=2755281 RepID=A0AA38MU24_9CUCU|nr:hypothetical protein Zmor_002586 [Zophobas morio]KAJ3667224.1 hypothetical protein Zmor_002624 [Zophobas morio]
MYVRSISHVNDVMNNSCYTLHLQFLDKTPIFMDFASGRRRWKAMGECVWRDVDMTQKVERGLLNVVERSSACQGACLWRRVQKTAFRDGKQKSG